VFESGEFKSFLEDLPQVTSQGKLRVVIEVYSTPSGSSRANIRTATLRSMAMQGYFANKKKLSQGRVETVAMGSLSSISRAGSEVSPAPEDQSKALDRIHVK
jgi:hypothetical protein